MKKDSVTIVTGGGRGIGAEITRRMIEEGDVIVVGRNGYHLRQICKDNHASGATNAFAVIGDVTDPKTAGGVAELCEELHYRHIRLVSNAGIGKSGATETFDPETWNRIFDVNVNGAFHFVQALVPLMLKAGQGSICLMSSVAGLQGSSHNAAYVASKHALVGFAKALGKEYGKRGIVTTALCPGFVESEMTDRSITSLAIRHKTTREKARERIERVNPQRRILSQGEVAEMVAFVCSDKGASMNGTAIDMSGGQ